MGDQVDALQSQIAAKDGEIEGFQIEFRNIMQGEIFKGPWGSKEKTAKGNLMEEKSEEREIIKLIESEPV
jgi:hypothetical protein